MSLDFSTSSGAYHIERTGSNLTPTGGLIAFASFVNEQRIILWLKSNATQLNFGTTFANIAIAFQGKFIPKLEFN